jgi:hypothetical protein
MPARKLGNATVQFQRLKRMLATNAATNEQEESWVADVKFWAEVEWVSAAEGLDEGIQRSSLVMRLTIPARPQILEVDRLLQIGTVGGLPEGTVALAISGAQLSAPQLANVFGVNGVRPTLGKYETIVDAERWRGG